MNLGSLVNSQGALADLLVAMGLGAVLLLVVLVLTVKVLRNALVFIPNSHYGIVERKWGRSRGETPVRPHGAGRRRRLPAGGAEPAAGTC